MKIVFNFAKVSYISGRFCRLIGEGAEFIKKIEILPIISGFVLFLFVFVKSYKQNKVTTGTFG